MVNDLLYQVHSSCIFLSFQVVNVWTLVNNRGKGVARLKQPLFGHTAAVFCLAVSSAFNIIVSGSCDKTCIIWDLSRLRYTTQLRNHVAPVAAVCINDLTVRHRPL